MHETGWKSILADSNREFFFIPIYSQLIYSFLAHLIIICLSYLYSIIIMKHSVKFTY